MPPGINRSLQHSQYFAAFLVLDLVITTSPESFYGCRARQWADPLRKSAGGAVKLKGDIPQRAVALFSDKCFGVALQGGVVWVVHFWAMYQQHHVGVLFDFSRVPQVGKNRLAIIALFRFSIELCEGDDCHVELFGQCFQAPRVRTNLLVSFVAITAGHQT